ncbi:MAG TPA: ATP-binding protein [Vicinamibacteria bacterium]|nr:ATP-binding protein [Vicinamibacteria bacterium]
MERFGSWKIGLVIITSTLLLACALHNIREKNRFELLDDGVFWDEQAGRVYAKRIDPNGPGDRAGLQPGDILVLIEDEPVERAAAVREALDASRAGQLLRYQILREDTREALALTVTPLPTGNVPAYYFLAAVGIFCLAVGTVVYVRRRGEAATAHFYMLCLFWFLAYGFSFTGELDGWDRAFFSMELSGLLFFPPIFLHFALCFPDKKTLVIRHPWILWAIYAPSAILLYLSLAAGVAFFSPLAWGDRFLIDAHDFLDRILPTFVAVMSVSALIAFVDTQRNATRITVKKQTKWIVWGTALGVLPFALFYAIPYLLGVAPGLTMQLSVVPLALIPLSFAYAIVKYRLMDVEVLFKRGMVFTLATAAVGSLYLAIFLAGAHYMVGDEHSTILAVLAALIVVLVFTPIKSRIQVGIDRLFYRERYDYRRALMALSRDLNSHLDLDRLSSRLVDRIGDTFEVDKVALLAASSEEGLAVQAGRGLSESEWRSTRLSEGSSLYRRLSEGEAVYSGETELGTANGAFESLDISGLSYAIPCCSHGKVVGVILLGRRWDESSLTSEDMDLLVMLSAQAATALENASLYRSLQRKASEFEALKEHSENTIESLETGILVVDLEGTVVRWNRALEKFYGLPRDRALGRSFNDIFPEPLREALRSSMGADWWKTAETSGIARLNLQNMRQEKKVVKLQVAPFLTSDERPEGTIVIFEDITLRVELETQLQLREKMASLGLLAAGVAHEINTPLTGISSFTQMLRDQTTESDPRSELLHKIERQTERASKIVNNLLNFARQGRSSLVPVKLNDVVRDVLSLLEHQLTRARIKVRLDLGEDLADVLGDENKLQQVFLNLILNAQDAMPSGGWLSIRTATEGDNVSVSVSDTGLGIRQEDVKRIYDPFFTTKRAGASGTGLGLSITYGIIQEHSGQIAVESAVDQGTSFRLLLPTHNRVRAPGADDLVRANRTAGVSKHV